MPKTYLTLTDPDDLPLVVDALLAQATELRRLANLAPPEWASADMRTLIDQGAAALALDAHALDRIAKELDEQGSEEAQDRAAARLQ